MPCSSPVLEDLLYVIEPDQPGVAEIELESTARSSDQSRDCAKLQGRCRDLVIARGRIDLEGITASRCGIAARILAIPDESETARLLGSEILGLDKLAGAVEDADGDLVGIRSQEYAAGHSAIGC